MYGWCKQEHMQIFSGIDAHFISCREGEKHETEHYFQVFL